MEDQYSAKVNEFRTNTFLKDNMMEKYSWVIRMND